MMYGVCEIQCKYTKVLEVKSSGVLSFLDKYITMTVVENACIKDVISLIKREFGIPHEEVKTFENT